MEPQTANTEPGAEAIPTLSSRILVEVLRKLQQPSTSLSVIINERKKRDRTEQWSTGALAPLTSEYQAGSGVLRRCASVVGRYSFSP